MKEAGGADDDSDDPLASKSLRGKAALKAKIKEEKLIREKEQKMRSKSGSEPTSVKDFERLLVSDADQSYLWIQYIAFVLEEIDAAAARKIAERAVRQVSMSADNDKLNLWIAFMNLEAQCGTEETLASVTKRALDVNDRKKVYL